MESRGPSFRERLLIEALTVLAADAETQVAWLIRHGVEPDEIALDFDHASWMAEPLVADGRLAPEALAALREIDVTLGGMSGRENAERWTAEALSTDEGWALARQLARRVLVAELGVWRRPLPEITVIR